jgi:hypothetical protein
MNEEPPDHPFGCLFLSWIGVLLAGAALAGIIFQKLCPSFFQ